MKTELYLVPCIDLALVVADGIAGQATRLAAVAKVLEEQLAAVIAHGDHSDCQRYCYAPARPGSTVAKLRRQSSSAPAKMASLTQYADIVPDLEKATELLGELRGALADDLQAPPLYSASGPGAQRRMALLFADAAKHYDQPSLGRAARHYVGNAYTRTTLGEKALFAADKGAGLVTATVGGAVTGAGHAFIPQPFQDAVANSLKVAGGPQIIELLGQKLGAKLLLNAPKTVQSSMVSAVNKSGKAAADLVGLITKIAVTAHERTKAVDSGLLDEGGFEQNLLADQNQLKLAGKRAGSELFKKAARHVKIAKDKMDDMLGNVPLGSCHDAMSLAADVAKVGHHLDKAVLYLAQSMTLVTALTEQVLAWNELEAGAFKAATAAIGPFLGGGCANCVCHHQAIPNVLHPCYGPKKSNPAEPVRRMT